MQTGKRPAAMNRRRFLFLLLTLLTGSTCLGQEELPCGIWTGTLKLPNGKLRVVYCIEKRGDSLTAVLDSPDQYTKDIPVEKIYFSGDSIRLKSKSIGATYSGRYRKDRDCFEGKFSQNGKFSLRLERTDKRITWKRPQQPQPPFPYSGEEVTFRSADGKTELHGTLCLPEGKGPFPAVVMVSGSGWQDRNESLFGHQPFFVLADYLARNGIASLRYDDRYGDGSSLDFSRDAEGGIRFLNADPRIDARHTGVLGHSEGGTIAFLLASRMKEVKFIVSLAGALFPEETLMYQLRAVSTAEGHPEAADSITPAYFHRQAKASPSPWLSCFLSIDGKKLIRKTHCPVLALNGTRDLQVPVLNVERMQTLTRPHPDSEFLILPGLNHLMQHSETGNPKEYGEIEETVAPEVLDAVTKFIRKVSAH